jgi:uncharacterized protein YecE (DUF72 family)
MNYYIGCSGFHYKHWKGNFYPEKLPTTKWFEFYCSHFNTLELNVTFYRFPKLSTLIQWHDRAPEDFKFSVKVPRSITHFKKLHETERMLNDFYELVGSGLKDKLGSVLFQFPPNFSYTGKNIDRILASVNPQFENVVEFRHPSWWNEDSYAQLAGADIAFCGMSHHEFPQDLIFNTNHLYYRLHGSEQLYASTYPDEVLNEYAKQFKTIKHLKKAYIYFNNDIGGNAHRNATTLSQLLNSK